MKKTLRKLGIVSVGISAAVNAGCAKTQNGAAVQSDDSAASQDHFPEGLSFDCSKVSGDTFQLNAVTSKNGSVRFSTLVQIPLSFADLADCKKISDKMKAGLAVTLSSKSAQATALTSQPSLADLSLVSGVEKSSSSPSGKVVRLCLLAPQETCTEDAAFYEINSAKLTNKNVQAVRQNESFSFGLQRAVARILPSGQDEKSDVSQAFYSLAMMLASAQLDEMTRDSDGTHFRFALGKMAANMIPAEMLVNASKAAVDNKSVPGKASTTANDLKTDSKGSTAVTEGPSTFVYLDSPVLLCLQNAGGNACFDKNRMPNEPPDSSRNSDEPPYYKVDSVKFSACIADLKVKRPGKDQSECLATAGDVQGF